MAANNHFNIAVLGTGPGGYVAALKAAQLGASVAVVEKGLLGGTCLNNGCIPSKALLHVTELLRDAREAGEFGLEFGEPKVDIAKIREWKNQVIDRLVNGLVTLSKQREVQLVQGRATFEGPDRLRVRGKNTTHVKFKHAILATGSRAISLPGTSFEKSGRIMSSTGALALADIPETLLVVGAGMAGYGMGTSPPLTAETLYEEAKQRVDRFASESFRLKLVQYLLTSSRATQARPAATVEAS